MSPSSSNPGQSQSTDRASAPASNPFLAVQTDKSIVALRGRRNGYLMIATSRETLQYEALPDAVLLAAKAWAIRLEQLDAPRAYWMILSEATPHLHIHIFPRWPEDKLKGIPLFETREDSDAFHPAWSSDVEAALMEWSVAHEVELA